MSIETKAADIVRVMVADKDRAVRELVSTRLSNRGMRVSTAETTEEMLRQLEREPVDLVLISSDMERLGGRYPVERIRDRAHLVAMPVVLMTREDDIAELILGQDRGFDDFLIKPFSPLVLQLRVTLNIGRARARSESNALTHLPGNAAIEKKIKSKIEKGEKFSVLYIDINQFKAFNDRYSFEKGDDVIKHTAKLLLETRERVAAGTDCFVGHIGGDDFIVVVDPEKEEAYARAFIQEFDPISAAYYTDEDRRRGHVRVTNRRGKRENIPLMSCAVAACNNVYRRYRSLGEIAHDAAQVKSFLKSQPGSHYLRDRRSDPPAAIEDAVRILSSEVAALAQKPDTMEPLGRVLLNAGLINEEQLQSAIKRHLETGQRLGQTLIAMNLVSSQAVGHMLETKLRVPYVSLKNLPIAREVLRLFTLDFMRSHRVVPLEVCEGSLKLAMCDPFDLRTLDAIERVSQLKPSPCLALEDEFEAFFESLSREEPEKEKTGSFL